ncbi:hypothetical protein PBY51_020792 [Eleginops maclovinus]|uniref:Uncharacterized protein n=1 Tax=Eleginops maclovinus TaxID=56733 RepID=A0AAN7XTL9_ELEMC|nr:hypothetical protein PBY51_020792 [Eleginops maclovinus]
MSFSVKELCEMVNVSYDRVLEANVRVSNEEEDSVESDGGDTAANEDSLEHDPENDPDYTPVNEDAVAVDRGRSRKRANPDAWKDTMWMAVRSSNYSTPTTLHIPIPEEDVCQRGPTLYIPPED